MTVALAFSLAAPGWALSPPGETVPALPPPAKTTARKPSTPSSPAGKPASVGSAPCWLGVVVTTGDEFMVKSIGLTVFQSKETAVPITSWGLNDLIFARVRAAAPAGATVLRIPYNPARLPQHDAPRDGLLRDLKAEVAERMREATMGTNCQRYIQIGNSISRFGSTNYTVGGFGIVDQNVLLGHRVFLYAATYVRVFDGRDFSIIRHGSAVTNFTPFALQSLVGHPMMGPYRDLPAESFPIRPEDAAGDLALRDGVRAMLTESLDKTLPYMLGRRPARESDAK
ncbi:hypothetical protein [Bradyrhizobium guangdongense]|uniref:hypothetical protein n=1 Tax=Bradyrhizobium guangdongense TaxID=1325090 RepID=UPI001FF00F9F|nr:hypothetical protein [Bradyrhizobium guangdongense]